MLWGCCGEFVLGQCLEQPGLLDRVGSVPVVGNEGLFRKGKQVPLGKQVFKGIKYTKC